MKALLLAPFLILSVYSPVLSEEIRNQESRGFASNSNETYIAEVYVPDNAEEYFERGLSKFEEKNYRGAISDYKRAIKLDPNVSRYYSYRGEAEIGRSNYRNAIKDYNKAIKLMPDEAVLYNNRGYSKEQIKDYEGAIIDYTKSIELGPSSKFIAIAYSHRASAKSESGDYSGAVSDAEKSIEFDPDIEFGSQNLLFYQGRLDGNNDRLNKALNKNKDTVTPTAEQEAHCLKAQDYQGCMDYYSQSTKRKGVNSNAILRNINKGSTGSKNNTNQRYSPNFRPHLYGESTYSPQSPNFRPHLRGTSTYSPSSPNFRPHLQNGWNYSP